MILISVSVGPQYNWDRKGLQVILFDCGLFVGRKYLIDFDSTIEVAFVCYWRGYYCRVWHW